MNRLVKMCLFVLAGVAMLSLTSAPVLAQDGTTGGGRPAGNPMVNRCLTEMAVTTSRTVSAIQESGRRGVAAIVRLAHEGASDEQLRQAAGRAREAVLAAARRGNSAIDALETRCVAELLAAGAPRAAIDAIHRGAASSHETINRAAHAAVGAINRALERATSASEG